MAGNNFAATLSVDSHAAQRGLRAAASAMEEVSRAGKDVTAQQRLAMTALSNAANKTVEVNRKAQESYAKLAREAVESTKKIELAEKDAASARRRANAESRAKVDRTTSATANDAELAALRQETEQITQMGKLRAADDAQHLAAMRLGTEEARQQNAIQSGADRAALAAVQRETEEARKLLLVRKAATEESRRASQQQESAARLQSTALRDQLAVQRATSSMGLGNMGMRFALYDIAQGFQAVAIAAFAASGAVLATGVTWEREFADVRRTMNITTADGIQSATQQAFAAQKIRDELVGMAKTMPIDWTEITNIATLANQLGVARADLGSFTETVAKFSAVTGVSVEDASTALGRIASLVPGAQHRYEDLGDAIAKVGVTSAATETQIIRIATQIASTASTAQLTGEQVIGLAGALASIAVPPELSRSVLTRVFGDIGRAVNDGGADLQNFARVSGMSAKDFSEAWTNGKGAQVFQRFVSGIHDEGADAEATIRSLGITSVRDVPTLVRLANAFDSTGKAGGLLAESMRNANNAGGELDRQYGIIADTVDSKLKVAANNIQAIFDEIAQSDLGFIGDVFDNLTESLGDFARTLNDNYKLFGSIELPFTNAQGLGFAAVVTGIVGALSLLVSVGGRGAANLLSIRALFTDLKGGGAKGSAAALAQVAASANAATPAIVGVGNASQAAAPKLTSTGRAIAAVHAGLDRANVGFANFTGKVGSYTDAYSRTASGIISVQRGFEATTGAVGRFTSASGAGGAALNRIEGAASRAGSAVGKFMGAWGPLVIPAVAIALLQGVDALQQQSEQLGTTGNDVVTFIKTYQDAGAILSRIKINTSGALGELGLIPKNIAPVIDSATEFKQALGALDSAQDNWFLNSPVTKWFTEIAPGAQLVNGLFADGLNPLKQYEQVISKVDTGFEQLFAAGNTDAAVAALNKFNEGLSTTQIDQWLDKAPKTRAELEGILASLDVEGTDANIAKLARGTLPEFNESLDRTAGVVVGTSEEFAQMDADVNEFTTSISSALAGAVSSQDAWAAAQEKAVAANDAAKASWEEAGNPIEEFSGTAKASLDDYFASMDAQIASQQNFVKNLATLMQQAGPEYAQAAAALGAEFTQTLVDGGAEALDKFKSQTDSQLPDVLGSLSAGIASLTPNVTAKIGTLGAEAGAEFYRRLFTGEDISSLLEEFGIGDGVVVPVKPEVQGAPGANAELDGVAKDRTQHTNLELLGVPQANVTADEVAKDRVAHYSTQLNKGDTPASLDTIANARLAPFFATINQPAKTDASGQLDQAAADRQAAIIARAETWEANQLLNSLTTPRTVYIQAVVDRSTLPDLNGAVSGSGRPGMYTGGQVGKAAGLPGFAAGRVPGPRQANKRTDNIPAMLRSREWVIPEESVDKYGTGLMNGIVNRTIDTANLYRPVPVVVNGGGGGSNGTSVVELSVRDRQLLQAIQQVAGRSFTFAPSEAAAAASRGNTSGFSKGAN